MDAKPMTNAEIYRAAHALILSHSSFTRINSAQRPNEVQDQPPCACMASDKRARWFNAVGAIIAAAGSWKAAESAWLDFRSMLVPDGGGLYPWIIANDHPQHLAALLAAAEAAEGRS